MGMAIGFFILVLRLNAFEIQEPSLEEAKLVLRKVNCARIHFPPLAHLAMAVIAGDTPAIRDE
jgi:hypothetical protein